MWIKNISKNNSQTAALSFCLLILWFRLACHQLNIHWFCFCFLQLRADFDWQKMSQCCLQDLTCVCDSSRLAKQTATKQQHENITFWCNRRTGWHVSFGFGSKAKCCFRHGNVVYNEIGPLGNIQSEFNRIWIESWLILELILVKSSLDSLMVS